MKSIHSFLRLSDGIHPSIPPSIYLNPSINRFIRSFLYKHAYIIDIHTYPSIHLSIPSSTSAEAASGGGRLHRGGRGSPDTGEAGNCGILGSKLGGLREQTGSPRFPLKGSFEGDIGGFVKIMVPFWVLSMIRHLVFRGPKGEL